MGRGKIQNELGAARIGVRQNGREAEVEVGAGWHKLGSSRWREADPEVRVAQDCSSKKSDMTRAGTKLWEFKPK